MRVLVLVMAIGTFGMIHKKVWSDVWKRWKLEDELRLSKLKHYEDRQEYWEESWSTVLMSKNSSISNNSVKHKHAV